MTTNLKVALLATTLTWTTTARADEVVLQDGRTLYGTVEVQGNTLRIETRKGEVTVPRAEVLRTRSAQDLRQDLRAMAARCGQSAFAYLQLASTAQGWALEDEMWAYLDQALTHQQLPADVGERVHEFLGTLEPEVLAAKHRKSSGEPRAREILASVRGKTSPARLAAAARVLSFTSGVDEKLREQARALAFPEQRVVANEALWLRETDAKNRQFVLRSAVFDASPQVRGKVLSLANASKATATSSEYLAAWLVHSHPTVRVRAADALAELGERSAVEPLVRAGPYAAAADSNIGTRANVAFITQQSYIRDFDVEVAQSSFIADPKVDALTYGSVLDVRVASVLTERVVHSFRRAITKLEGADPGDDASRWEAWLAGRRNAPAR